MHVFGEEARVPGDSTQKASLVNPAWIQTQDLISVRHQANHCPTVLVPLEKKLEKLKDFSLKQMQKILLAQYSNDHIFSGLDYCNCVFTGHSKTTAHS